MQSKICENCGGCCFRHLTETAYRQEKEKDFRYTLSKINNATPQIDESIFIPDHCRRRAELDFAYLKKELVLGFYKEKTHSLIDVPECPMLDEKLNKLLPSLHEFLEQLCQIKWQKKGKNKKMIPTSITSGTIKLLQADNGIDITIDTAEELNLEHRLLIAEYLNKTEAIGRFSWTQNQKNAETIVSKISPELHIKDCVIDIPSGVFLQASKQAETAMIEKVLNYIGNTSGKMVDLFCGLGTFTYPLAQIKGNTITSVDSFVPSLKGLKKAICRNQLQNVNVVDRNLFKYPFDADDLKGVKVIVMDPPRAGAHEQCRAILKLAKEGVEMPEKIIFISCNPKTFVPDAQMLIEAGYCFTRVTMVDQFVYSKHQELIALFIRNSQP